MFRRNKRRKRHKEIELQRLKSFDYDAVILIDMQEEFVPRLRRGGLKKILPGQLVVLKHCEQHDIPTVILEYHECGKTIPTLSKIIQKIPRHTHIEKTTNSGFNDTELESQLNHWGSKRLLLMGINAQFCVRATARDAIQLGYKIITSHNLISGQSGHEKDDCIDWYGQNGTLLVV